MAANNSIGARVSGLPTDVAAPAARNYMAVVLLASAALMVAWSFAVPVFEGPDEPAHWRYANFLNRQRSLPLDDPSCPEAGQPPLYYLLIAPLAHEVDLPPVGYVGEEYSRTRRFLYPPRVYQNTTGDLDLYWPFRLARLISVIFSVIAVWFCALAGAEASGSASTGLLVGGLVAFWPMFSFRGMNVSNDSLLLTLSALEVYLIVRLIKRGFTWRLGIFAAVAGAAAFLTKINAVVLAVVLLLAVLYENGRWRTRLFRATVLGLIMLAIVAPWLIRNRLLYGDILAQRVILTAVSGLVVRHTLGSFYFRYYFPLRLLTSFIGHFGWLTLALPFSVYVVYTIALVSAFSCWVSGVWRRRIDRRLSAILFCAIVLNLCVIVQMNLTQSQAQGRYFFPTLPAMALLAGLGLESRRSWSAFRTLLTLGGLAAINVVILVYLVIPAYWPPVIIL